MIVKLDPKRRLTIPAALAPVSCISAVGGQVELADRTQGLSGQPGICAAARNPRNILGEAVAGYRDGQPMRLTPSALR